MKTCAKCGRSVYSGTKRIVAPNLCVTEDGTSCRAYQAGVEAGVMNKSEDGMVWYAATDSITRMGPFKTQVDAWQALRLAPEIAKRTGRLFPSGALVWPERAETIDVVVQVR